MTNNSSHKPFGDPWGSHLFGRELGIVLTILGVLICILDLIGNITVIHIVRTRIHMRTTINLLIANLAAADLLMVIVVIYLTKHYYVGFRWFGGVLGQVTCKLALSLQILSIVCSVLTLCAISFDRFFAIVFPLARFMTFSKTKRLMAFLWIFSIAFCIPVTVASVSTVYGDGYACIENWEGCGINHRAYLIAFFLVGYVIPLVVMTTLYLIMGIKLWRASAPGHQTAEAMNRIKQGRRKATKMLITVVVVFTLCWLPLQVAEFLRQFAPEVYWTIPLKLNFVLPYFGIANSVVNPFIYIVFCEKFRLEFATILCFSRVGATSDDVRNGSLRSFPPTIVKSTCFTEDVKRQSITTSL